MKAVSFRYPPAWLLLEIGLRSPQGPFDLDPAWPAICLSHPHALKTMPPDQGMVHSWPARASVWVCPIFTGSLPRWMEKMARHGQGIALVQCRTDTRWFQEYVWPVASSMLFLRGRLRFEELDGTGLRPSILPGVLIAYGRRASDRLVEFYYRHRHLGHLLLNPC